MSSDRLTAEPGTVEFLKQLLEIAQGSDHPMDKALTRIFVQQLGEVNESLQEMEVEGHGS